VHPPFEILEHPSDVGFRAHGHSQKEMFENSALALFSLSCDLDTVQEKEPKEIEVTAGDLETLLYAWLAELLAISEAERFVFRRVNIAELSQTHARGTAYGENFVRERHRRGTHIKAVTMHQLKIEQKSKGWIAQVFLDL
jgi:SHS2 domain-containing protein